MGVQNVQHGALRLRRPCSSAVEQPFVCLQCHFMNIRVVRSQTALPLQRNPCVRSLTTRSSSRAVATNHVIESPFHPLRPGPGNGTSNQPNIRQRLGEWEREHRLRVEQEEGDILAKAAKHIQLSPLARLLTDRRQVHEETFDEEGAYDEPWGNNSEDGQLFGAVSNWYAATGDAIPIMEPRQCSIGVCVGRLGQNFVKVLRESGDVSVIPNTRTFWHIPKFASPAEIERVLPHLPAFASELDRRHDDKLTAVIPDGPFAKHARLVAAKPIIAQMQRFRANTQRIYRDNSEALDNMASVLCLDRQAYHIKRSEAARKLLKIPDHKQPTAEEEFVVYKAFHEGPFVSAPGVFKTGEQQRLVYPTRDLEIIRLVHEWWRDYVESRIQAQNGSSKVSTGVARPGDGGLLGRQIIADFISRARKVIRRSREDRTMVWSALVMGTSKKQHKPSQVHRDGPEVAYRTVKLGDFTLNDIVILRALEMWAAKNCYPVSAQPSSVATSIMQAIDMYGDVPCTHETGFLLLKELGMVLPWASQMSLRVGLPGNGVDPKLDKAWTAANNSVTETTASDLTDTMLHLRKDWGDLDAFCIDSSTTVDVDDAISLERIEGDPSRAWLHVHVAHPSAFVSPVHPIAKFARLMSQTYYGPAGTHPMMPRNFSQNVSSLDSNRPCLTFSALLGDEGNLIDCKITPGILRNVHFVTPETVEEILSNQKLAESARPDKITYAVGHNALKAHVPSPRQRKSATDFTASQMQSLKGLMGLLKRWQERRLPEWQHLLDEDTRSPHVRAHWISDTTLNRTSMRIIEGDPTIEVTIQEHEDSIGLVREAMLVAGVVCGLWCQRRGIAAPFRQSSCNPNFPSSPELYEKVIKPYVDSGQEIPVEALLDFYAIRPRAALNSQPGNHIQLGVPVYVQTTSPLRRYGDLLAHWQVDAALRDEALSSNNGKNVKTRNPSVLDAESLQMQLNDQIERQGQLKTLIRAENDHWYMQWLARSFYLKEGPIPDNLVGVVVPQVNHNAQYLDYRQFDVMIPKLGRKGKLIFHRTDEVGTKIYDTVMKAQGIQMGDHWEVEIREVLAGLPPYDVIVRPKRLVHRKDVETLTAREKLNRTPRTLNAIRGMATRNMERIKYPGVPRSEWGNS